MHLEAAKHTGGNEPFLNKGRYAHRFLGATLFTDYDGFVTLCVKYVLDIILPAWEAAAVPGDWGIAHHITVT